MQVPSPRLQRTARALALLGCAATQVEAVVWDKSAGTTLWSEPTNWDTDVEPDAASDVVFPAGAGLGTSITLTAGELARSLQFDAAYSLSSEGTLTLANGNFIQVAEGISATINTPLTVSGALTKTGNGILTLVGANTLPNGTVISGGTLRVNNAAALGAAGSLTRINAGTTLQLGAFVSLDRPLSLMQGGTLGASHLTSSFGTSSFGTTTIDAAAVSVTLAGGPNSQNSLTIGNAANDLTGGSAATVIHVTGPGGVTLGASSNYDGSWNIPTGGRLTLAVAGALGDRAASTVTLSGGTLFAKAATETNFTASAGNNLLVTANSSILTDRASSGAGLSHTFGQLSIGTNTLTVTPGNTASSGTSGIVIGNVNLNGDPVFAINDSLGINGKLTTGALLGGATARTILKTGNGDLAVTGGASNLATGSSFSATGSGAIELLFPNLGADATVNISPLQMPLGPCPISITGGTLRLLADGSGNSTPQTYVLPAIITLAGNATLDSDRRSGSSFGKTFELPGLSLAAGSAVGIAGGSGHGFLVSGGLTLQGSATLQGSSIAGRTGLLTVNGGILGGPDTMLTLASGSSSLNLTLNAAGTYGGGTTMSGGNVTLGAANALGTGPLTVSGGTLVANASNSLGPSNLAVSGGSLTVNASQPQRGAATTLNGGTLTLNVPNALGSGPLDIAGGTLVVNSAGVLPPGSLTMNGGTLRLGAANAYTGPGLTLNNATVNLYSSDPLPTSSLNLSGNSSVTGSGSGSTFSPPMPFPPVTVVGATTFTVAIGQKTLFPLIHLGGDMEFKISGLVYPAEIQSVTENGAPRMLKKSGSGTVKLSTANSHSGGTELREGQLEIGHAAGLGSGPLILLAENNFNPASATFAAGLVIENDILAKAGPTGPLSFGGDRTTIFNGDLTLERDVNVSSGIYNGLISGSGNLNQTHGTLVLTNPSNSFTGTVKIHGSGTSAATMIVSSDAVFGNPGNPLVLAGTTSGVLRIDGSFTTGRSITTMAANGIFTVSPELQISSGQTLTMNGPIAGAGNFLKTGDGTLVMGPNVDSSGRGAAPTTFYAGTVRLQGLKNLSDAGEVYIGGRLEALYDGDGHFGHPLNGSGVLFVDRSPGGAGSNHRHRFGTLALGNNTLTVEGAHGCGLSLGAASVYSSATLQNDAPGELLVDSIQVVAPGNPSGSEQTLTLGGSGTTRILGAVTQPAGTQIFGLRKTGSGTLKLGTSTSGFNGWLTLSGGVMDLNGRTLPPGNISVDGAADNPLRLTGGTLQINGYVDCDETATLSGSFLLNSSPHFFVIGSGDVLTLDGPMSGAGGIGMQSENGVLRLTGAGSNTFTGQTVVGASMLELGKSSGDAIGAAGLLIGSKVRLLGPNQINDNAMVTLESSGAAALDLNNYSDKVGPLTLTQVNRASTIVKTGATGTLVLGSNLTFNNNTNAAETGPRNILITGSGSFAQPASDGTLDLGGVVRTVHVTTTTTGTRQALANATIETRIINGGILKTGPRTLYLTNPANSFSGGIVVSQGLISTGGTGSFGSGPVTFNNAAGTAAGLDLGTAAGSMTNPLTIGGAGSFTLVYGGPIPHTLELGGGITLQKLLPVEVTHGTTGKDRTATLELSGTITDGAGSFGLSKTGNGTLKLGPANAYSGETLVGRGTLHVTGPGSLGDGAAPLRIDGGCAMFSTPFTLARDVTITASGGSIRCDSAAGIELAGHLDWGPTRAASFGSGTTILTGTTAGNGALQLGVPTDFSSTAGVLPEELGWGHRLSLRGSAALPAGNLSFDRGAILELGNGNFSRGLGTGPGQFQMPTGSGGGWAAFGQDRIVNIGGNGQTVVWGQAAPAFLNKNGNIGSLFLGSAGGTHTLVFENNLNLDNGLAVPLVREIVTSNGPALIDARMTGDLVVAGPSRSATLMLASEGTLMIDGNILGNIALRQEKPGTTRFNGDNDFPGDLFLMRGAWIFQRDESVGSPSLITVESEGHLDASALASPLTAAVSGRMHIDGSVNGHVLVPAEFSGHGAISGDLGTSPHSEFSPSTGGLLEVGGNFTLATGSSYNIPFTGTIPGSGFPQVRVAGNVNLDGHLRVNAASGIAPGQTMVLALNDGTDPINGQFAGLPEGSILFIGNGLGLKITYRANGDGGLMGNDIGATVVDWYTVSDRSLAVAAPLAVAFGQEITLSYTLGNAGPAAVTHGHFLGQVPPGSEFLGSTPSGTFDNSTTLRVPLPDLLPGDSNTVVMRFLAPLQPGSLQTGGSYHGDGPDPDGADPAINSVVAILPGGRLEFREVAPDPLDGSLNLTVASLPGVHYLLEASEDLFDWKPVDDFHGTGELLTLDLPAAENNNHGFFRLRLIPFEEPGLGH